MEEIIKFLKDNNINFEILNDSKNFASISFENEKGEYIVDKDLYEYTLNYPNFNAEFGSEQYILDLIKLDFI